ncbi:MAG: hypothetical protein Kow0092_20100 [Deferrisomatales bacterium]
MLQALFAAALLLVMGAVGRVPESTGLFEPARLSLSYGFLLLEAYLVGGIFRRVGLPRISGYIVTGIVCGPYVLGFIGAEMAVQMKLIDRLALSFIALTAGAELKMSVLRERGRVIGWIIGCLTLLVLLGIATATGALRHLLPFARHAGGAEVVAMGALMGVIAVARSPTSAIAIIKECRAGGRFTDTVFGVTVAMDSLVILLFGLVVAVSEAVVRSTGDLDLVFLGIVGLQLGTSLGIGAAVGHGVAFYIRRIEKDLSVLLVVLAFLITQASQWLSHVMDAQLGVAFHLEPLLIATAAGFTVQNFTGEGRRLLEGLHAIALPIFVVFFSMAGVSLKLGTLAGIWPVALLFVGARMGLISTAGYLGCRMARESERFARLCGFAFYTQAGVSLGLTQELVRRFPEWDVGIGTFLVACITVNEIVGPVSFKFALDRMGESGKA